jgi:hypothetical protein
MQVDKSATIDPLTTTNYHIVREGGCVLSQQKMAMSGSGQEQTIPIRANLVGFTPESGRSGPETRRSG